MTTTRAILLPGAVTPAELAYGALVGELGAGVDARYKDLELYAGPVPPLDYGLGTEVAGILRFADEAGFDTFHLLGYSGGGVAALDLAHAAFLAPSQPRPHRAGLGGLAGPDP
ncbi:hypothetical protein BH23CHL8_BH23CHL8_02040 [soil metagenome]